MTPADIRAEIKADPAALGYAALGTDDAALTALINKPQYVKPVSRFVTLRTVYAELTTQAAGIHRALKTAATPPVSGTAAQLDFAQQVDDALSFLLSTTGLDVGDPYTQGQIDACVTNGVLTATQGNALKAMANKTLSRAEVLWGALVAQTDVRRALWNDDGTRA